MKLFKQNYLGHANFIGPVGCNTGTQQILFDLVEANLNMNDN